MEVSLKTMALAASVSHFEIIEVWCEQESNYDFECKFIHTAADVEQKYNSLDFAFPSKQLCQRAKEAPEKFCWLSDEDCFNRQSIKSELSIFLDSKGVNRNIILVCYSFSVLVANMNVVQYLKALSLSIYVAAYIMDDENIGNELDMVVHEINSIEKSGIDSTDSSDTPSSGSSTTFVEKGTTVAVISSSLTDTLNQDLIQLVLPCPPPTNSNTFSYSIYQLPVLKSVNNNMAVGNFGTSMEYLTKGSNSKVYRAKYNNTTVVVKMLREENLTAPIALHELRTEKEMLVRVSHENIVNIIGTGKSPNDFIVLEYLGGGTLQKLLHGDPKTSTSSSHLLNLRALFKKKTFSLTQNLLMARDIARALHYLHDECCPDACIIHRDVKPDNIGVTEDMKLKLFDFGLMTCVKRPALASDVYQLSGCTGSLRYMAPEVALRKPYNQKVDVHSFGILFWEILTGTVPFKDVDKDKFFREVVDLGCRPKIPETLPAVLSNLLTDCWKKDPAARPSFGRILTTLDAVLVDSDYSSGSSSSNHSSSSSSKSPRKKSPHHGSSKWFGMYI